MDLRDDPMPTAQPLVPRPVDVAAPAPVAGADQVVESTSGPGIKRMVLTAALSAMLLVGGAVAVVSAASPDPSASPAPSTTTTPDTNGGTTAPSTRPNHTGGMKGDCPNMGGSGSGSSGSGGSSAPSTTAPSSTPQT